MSFRDSEEDDIANVGALLQQTRMSEFFMHDTAQLERASCPGEVFVNILSNSA